MTILRSFLLNAAAVGALLFVGTGVAAAPGFWSHPAIPGYGGVHIWPQATYLPDKNAIYKAVFNITRAARTHDKPNGALEHVARAVNAFAAEGVPLSQLKFVAVVAGPATSAILTDQAYEARYHVHNPNIGLIAALRNAGVKIVVCGNALGGMKLTPSDVEPQVGVALSALSTLVMLEDSGYALVPM